MLVAPTESATLKALGRSHPLPERYGVDILFAVNPNPGDVDSTTLLCGIQRKEYSDLLNSTTDGRLQREMAQMLELNIACLVIEGNPKWSLDGQLMSNYGIQWSRKSHHSLIASVQSRGIHVQLTDSLLHTKEFAEHFYEWTSKPRHSSLDTRPKIRGSWGKATSREFSLHLLQSFDKIGPVQAEAIYTHFGGTPLAWTVTKEELEQVPGIGPVRAKSLADALGNLKAPVK